jgi:hypothetical protein
MNVPVLSQHDPRYGSQRLGTQNGATIAGQGCGITCIAMANTGFNPGDNRLPNNIDDIFTNQGGYVGYDPQGNIHRSPWQSGNSGCDLIDWGAVTRLLPNVNVVANANYPAGTPADLPRIKQHIDGGGLVILQVFYGGNPANMHFVLALGYKGDDIEVNDPENGKRSAFSSKLYGTGDARQDIFAAHFVIDGTPDTPAAFVPPQAQPTQSPSAPAVVPSAIGITQAQLDSAVAQTKQVYLDQIAALTQQSVLDQQRIKDLEGLCTAQGNTIDELNKQLGLAVPEYVRTWQDGPVQEVISTAALDLIDFSGKMPRVALAAGEIVTIQGAPFEVSGIRYYRTRNSVAGGYYYGVPVGSVQPYRANPQVTPVLDLSAKKAALSASQNLHVMAADNVGFLQGILNKLGGKS